ncbi:MAG TPA: flagellar regulator YcgR PilZN domain-containing protein [Caldimonas sp.]|jgi:c-di-GMP-binding flagellar brake protein YcgR|nr:flagellar regulator YcgR PilZN domain-containing protein [Caldimonas sp.]
METRPAALQGMSGGEGLDEFRVSSQRDIGLLLKQLLDGSVLLNLNGSDGRVFTSAIWTLDSTRATIGFNADPNDPAMQSVLHSREVVVVGYLESVKVQFDVQNLVLVHGNKASVLSCPFPREMFRFQRRNAFRVRPLMRAAPVARLRHPDQADSELSLRIIDLSISGCALFLPADLPMMNAGVLLGGVRMELDADTRLDVSLRLQHVTSLNTEARGVRLGFEFVRPGGDTVRTLQRFIDLTQKRGKLMALN